MKRRFATFVRLKTVICALALSGLAVSQFTLVPAAVAEATTGGDVVRVRLGGDKNQTRIVVELDKSVNGHVVTRADDGDRQVIALPDVDLDRSLEGKGQGLITDWKIEKVAGSTRLHLDFSDKARIYRRFLLPPADGISVYRYVVDIVPQGATPQAAAVAPLPVVTRTVAQALTPNPENHKKVIVIDAGHGGKDPGAHGKFSLEKDINLASAKTLRDILEKTGRYKVIMTRDTDSFVDLPGRVRIARSANADLFISLHSDSGGDGSVSGASIYTLSDSGTERAAKKAMVKGDWSLSDVTSSDRMVDRILIDLTQRATKNRSATFAQLVMDHIEASTPLLKANLRQAGFVVLLAPDVPAVLLEMGYVNNDHDEAMLNNPAHRTKMMGEVAQAIDQYFDNNVRYASFAGLN
ncbi:N-acetylmuramoyl-L-alanine amidase [Asticcacaulis sp. EMRT-3]|uniref:N-acetylmuramoyl-L-alanine amidase family protein n=1 Tax=Asticcacaulis sp. EMRT-3 TaxID=3040349 RepID=UPI0024AE8E25|nr:N-acetylmuramoyl-L-alanine amidase [Asticcacaulis sp. EMRT-3]MDI7774831.1 N-acetylmuramoyl-L-alanine amidase [Asticcacaulis sp. EMRT-3]